MFIYIYTHVRVSSLQTRLDCFGLGLLRREACLEDALRASRRESTKDVPLEV